MQPLTFALARKTVKFYRCSNCWGELEQRDDPAGKPDSYIVECKKCKEETKGYVTEHFVLRKQGESEFEARDVKRMLKKIKVLPSEEKTAAQLLQEMGF